MAKIVAPPAIEVIFSKPGRGWTPKEQVKTWLNKDPQIRYLLVLALRHLGSGVTSEDAEEEVHRIDEHLRDRGGKEQGLMLVPPPSKDDWKQSAKVWRDLAQTLCVSVQEALSTKQTLDFTVLNQSLATWEPLAQVNAKLKDQWLVARRLLWCAERVAQLTQREWDQIDRLSLPLANTPDFIKGHEGWVLACARHLKRMLVDQPVLHIPVALSDELQSAGTLATLVLELVKPGGGQVFHHPAEDALRTYAHPDFVQAMQEAWEAAKMLAARDNEENTRGTKEEVVCDGHWRLLQGDQPVREVRGGSASGAAALGWHHLLNGTVPDPGVIVLAQIARDLHAPGQTSRFMLEKVGSVPAKVEKIAYDGRFDTIVVADDENYGQAETALKQKGKLGPIRMVNLNNTGYERPAVEKNKTEVMSNANSESDS